MAASDGGALGKPQSERWQRATTAQPAPATSQTHAPAVTILTNEAHSRQQQLNPGAELDQANVRRQAQQMFLGAQAVQIVRTLLERPLEIRNMCEWYGRSFNLAEETGTLLRRRLMRLMLVFNSQHGHLSQCGSSTDNNNTMFSSTRLISGPSKDLQPHIPRHMTWFPRLQRLPAQLLGSPGTRWGYYLFPRQRSVMGKVDLIMVA